MFVLLLMDSIEPHELNLLILIFSQQQSSKIIKRFDRTVSFDYKIINLFYEKCQNLIYYEAL